MVYREFFKLSNYDVAFIVKQLLFHNEYNKPQTKQIITVPAANQQNATTDNTSHTRNDSFSIQDNKEHKSLSKQQFMSIKMIHTVIPHVVNTNVARNPSNPSNPNLPKNNNIVSVENGFSSTETVMDDVRIASNTDPLTEHKAKTNRQKVQTYYKYENKTSKTIDNEIATFNKLKRKPKETLVPKKENKTHENPNLSYLNTKKRKLKKSPYFS